MAVGKYFLVDVVYTDVTWAEDMATQGCDQSADPAAGMAWGGASRPVNSHSGAKAINPRGLGTESPSKANVCRFFLVYAVGVRILLALPLACMLAILAWAQTSDSQTYQTAKFDNKHPPHFEDFPVSEKWNQSPAPLKLMTRSERMFQTQLTNAAKEPPNFAGHYRITYWGCGSNCSAGALVDLQTGGVFPPPLSKSSGSGWERWIMCTACFDGADDEFHPDSRLMIVRCGLNYSERLQKNVPDTYYFLWERDGFRQLLFMSGKTSGK
jgi:hypothetical protein